MKEQDHGYKGGEMGFLKRVAGVSLKNRENMKNLVIHEGRGVELLFLCVERSQFR